MRTARTTLLAIVLGAALALTAGAQARSVQGGIYGIVLRGPTKPICEVGMSCEAPAPGVILEFWRAGRLAGRVTTARNGTFRIALAAGRYSVRTTRKFLGGGLTPTLVTTTAGRQLRVVFRIDTGIR